MYLNSTCIIHQIIKDFEKKFLNKFSFFSLKLLEDVKATDR